MLLQLQHEHKPRQQPQPTPSPPKIQPIVISKIAKKQQVVEEPPQSIFFNPQFYHETSSFNFHTDGLDQLLKDSIGELPQNVASFLKERQKFSQQRIYQAIAHTSVDFVGIHMRDFNKGIKSQMQTMFQSIHDDVEAGIWDGRYEINQSRNKYYSFTNREKELVSYITSQLVKRNLEEFKEELQQSQIDIDNQTFDVSSSYHPKSENHKSKRAEYFVKKMQEEKKRHQMEMIKQIEIRKSLEVKTEAQKRQSEQQRKKQKHELVRRRVQRQNQMLKLQSQRRQKMQSQYLQMVSSFKKPLFKQIQQKYEERMLLQQKKKFKIMKEMMKERRSISFEEIQQHNMRYNELLDENEAFRQQKIQLKKYQQQIISSKRPYRSKFYSLAVSEEPKIDPLQVATAMTKRKIDYAQHVKKNFMPRADEKKQQQLQQLAKRINNHRKNSYHSRKYIEQGKRNLEKFHQLIAQLRAKNKIKENISIQQLMKPKYPKKVYKNYLQQAKQSHIKSLQKEQNIELKYTNKHDDQIRLISKQREQKAKQKQLFLNSSIAHIDIHTHMKGNEDVEQNYLQSAMAKVALLKKYKFQQQQSKVEQNFS